MKRTNKHKKKGKKTPIIFISIIVILILGFGYYYYFVFNNQKIDDQAKEEEIEDNIEDEDNTRTEDSNKEIEEVKNDNGYIVGQELPNEPTYVQGVLIANKKNPLPKDFAPGVDKNAKVALDKMFEDAKKEGYILTAYSSYRSYEKQKDLYESYVEKDGKDKADRYSARPGYSEHQTGLAFDIGEIGKENLWLTEEFGETEAGKWLMDNAHKYGFILRYPKGKEHITGYMYESWHYRYLGVDLATKVKESGLTLEEFLGLDK